MSLPKKIFSRCNKIPIAITIYMKISKTTDIATELKYLKKNHINKYKPVNSI
jgi:hypothetical protein